MTGIMAASAIGGGAGGGGGVSLTAVIFGGEFASDWNNSAWVFGNNTCTPSGGLAPYTYLWSYTGTTGGSWGFTGSATAAAVNPTVSGVSGTATATLICTVTDAAANVVASNEATYVFENIFF
jgi:hypothetical protein